MARRSALNQEYAILLIQEYAILLIQVATEILLIFSSVKQIKLYHSSYYILTYIMPECQSSTQIMPRLQIII